MATELVDKTLAELDALIEEASRQLTVSSGTLPETFPTLHASQQLFMDGAERYNVGNTGRRLGKTELAKRLLAESAQKGHRAAYCAPTYPMAHQAYRELYDAAHSLLAPSGNEANKRLAFRSGGFVDIWSLENGGDRVRGQKYHRMVVDEAAMVPGLRHVWERVLRPTLADYEGDAFFFSTPRRGSDFEWLYRRTGKGWKALTIPTAITRDGTPHSEVVATNNPVITVAEAEEARQTTSSEAFAQEWLADFEATDSELVYELNEAKTIRTAPCMWSECKWRVVGIDPGGGDPTAIVPLGVSKDEQRIHQYGEFYRRGDVTVEMIAEYLTKLGKIDYVFVGETGGNVITNTLQRLGFPAQKADMRREEGLEHVRWLLESGRMSIDPACQNSIREFAGYKWSRKRDGTGEQFATRTPDWTHADAMDARRYAALGILNGIRGSTRMRPLTVSFGEQR